MSNKNQIPSLGGKKPESVVKGAPDESPKDDVEKKPDSKPQESDSLKKLPKSDGGIEVVALRAGFFKQSRKEEGDKFKVSKMKDLGSWMKCVDPKKEKDHQAFMKKKKEAGK